MSLQFNFNLDELDDDATILGIANQPATHAVESDFSSETSAAFNISSISDLICDIPPAISYSPLKIPVSNVHSRDQFVTILRRDLFDARFQLSSEDPLESIGENQYEAGNVSNNVTLKIVDAPSDLIAGLYEGGLKTWECSLDLTGYLTTNLDFSVHRNNVSILEIGCGTAIPSLYCLRRWFSSPSSGSIVIHLQDYNFVVLKLVTFYNIILTWYASPASQAYRETLDEDEEPQKDITQCTFEPGELSLTPELIAAFQNSLKEYHIEIKLISGSWHDTSKWISDNGISYNIVLSSETIYRISSLPSLVTLLRNAASQKSSTDVAEVPFTAPLCLIAAKVIYFGVGGGVESFMRALANDGGHSDTVYETKTGVARRIMKISWS